MSLGLILLAYVALFIYSFISIIIGIFKKDKKRIYISLLILVILIYLPSYTGLFESYGYHAPASIKDVGIVMLVLAAIIAFCVLMGHILKGMVL